MEQASLEMPTQAPAPQAQGMLPVPLERTPGGYKFPAVP